jgi:hypothetical protein
MLTLLIALMGPVPYTAAKPERPPTVAGWLALCEADTKACSDTLFDLVWERSVGDQKVGFCLPDDETPDQIAAKAVAWLKARPALAAAETDASLLKAMEAEYRCG